MSIYIFDVEADGPAVGLYSMVSLGIVRVDRDLKTSLEIRVSPISDKWVPDALAVSGFTREQHEAFPSPAGEIQKLVKWVDETNEGGRPIALSDNIAFDWQWLNYYCHRFNPTDDNKSNPFGFSGRRIGDVYAGLVKDFGAASAWKKYRKTKHTHNPVDDAVGNAEALITMVDKYGLTGVKGLRLS